ncbi:hypothetical protein RN001_010026 [Aquatica leii]|uniref:DUF243 domain-containing protein n=1 Tax=Aquatica leii TaxID=1421715 RepID=A0AAN7Q2X5_9COLE|nr:hypothetical protein RN001_010026 [Aquatica leii]
MKILVVAITLVVAINARPDVSHLPTGSYLPAGRHSSFGSGHGSGGGSYQSHDSFVVGSGSSSHGSFGGLGGSFHGGDGGSFHGGAGGSFHGGSGGSFHGGAGGSFHGGAGGSFHGGFDSGHGAGVVHDQKHVYFYAAPEEHSSSRLRIHVVPNAQRNTKIIFVKAPTYGSVTPEVVAPQSLSEDKTLVYVLVKRPEHGGQITIPAGVGVKASKPEVYFIKYKTQQDAQQQIHGGLQGQHVGSNVPDIGNAANFVSTLESGSSSGSHGLDNFGSVGPGGFDVRSGFTSGHGSVSAGHSSGSHDSSVITSGSNFGPAGASGPY